MSGLSVWLPQLGKWRGWRRYAARVLSTWVTAFEALCKRPVFDCRMCGQCILSYKGLTCPMRCPKNLRNGPCGGVRQDGNCEVYADQPCVHLLGWRRAQAVGAGERWGLLQPAIDQRLVGTSSWLNHLAGRDAAVYGPLRRQLADRRGGGGPDDLTAGSGGP